MQIKKVKIIKKQEPRDGRYEDEVVNHLQQWTAPLVPQANQQCQVLMPFQKAKRVGALLTSIGQVFHRVGATAEKVLTPPIGILGVCSRPFPLSQVQCISPFEVSQLLGYPGPMPFRTLKVIPSTLNWIWKQRHCYMCHPRNPQNCAHCCILPQL